MSNVSRAFNDFGRYLVQQSKSNLTRGKHRVDSTLYNSIGYTFKESPNSVEFVFQMEDYGEYLDKGVRGFKSSAKAPQSPFRFGSGTGKKGGLRAAIDKWVKQKRIQFRKPNGRFMTYDSTAFLVSRSIYNTGTRPTQFYSKPLEAGLKRMEDEVVEAYGLDAEDFLKNTFK